jgi:Rrf2 family protein
MLTRAADYAVRVMIHLAALPAGTRVQRAALAEETGVPESFLSKVLQGLVRASMIASRTGLNGGFELIAQAKETTMLDVIEAIDGPVALNTCVATGQGCERQKFCAAHFVWLDAQEAVTRVLRSASIDSLAAGRGRQLPALKTGAGRQSRKKKQVLHNLHGSPKGQVVI